MLGLLSMFGLLHLGVGRMPVTGDYGKNLMGGIIAPILFFGHDQHEVEERAICDLYGFEKWEYCLYGGSCEDFVYTGRLPTSEIELLEKKE